MDAVVVHACQQALLAVLILSAPVALTAVAVGLVVSIVQTATQVQEQTLSYVPKLVAVSAVLAVAGPWMLSELVRLATAMFEQVAVAW
ncbi:MAG: type III secretion system export apparatus subunit SctS [Blastocatellia bacterium]|jgi:flagellar biosynthetic protein FliQ|nr:type III secretion system export apparatus subunit SctS [Blastocatellia bacterium]MBK6427144.1 type III secretion system export apparatus subunit SctS [Blastocatellia bacterium]